LSEGTYSIRKEARVLMDFWQIIAKYWIEWLCGAVALGLGLWAKFSIRALRKKILDEFD
jgi:hypothetical protein